MKNRDFYILLTLIIVCLVSCGRKNTGLPGDEKAEILNVAPVLTDITLDDLYDSYQLVELETTEKCILGWIRKLIIKNNNIYIFDRGRISIFDMNGQLVSQINRRGRGPQEYFEIKDFKIFPNGDIGILDYSNQNINFYKPDGTFVSNVNVGIYCESYEILNDSLLLLDAAHYGEKTRFHVFDMNKEKVVNSFYPVSKHKLNYMHIEALNSFTRSGDTLYFNDVMNPRIYTIDAEGIYPVYYVKIGDRTPPDEFFEKSYYDVREFRQAMKENNYMCGTPHFSDGDQTLFLSYDENVYWRYCIFNKTSKENTVFDKIMFDDQLSYPSKEFYVFPNDNGILALSIQPSAFRNENGETIRSQFKDKSEMDNPVICIGKLK